MTQLRSYLLWQGRLVSLQFPYLQALFQQRPRHRMDEFEFQHPPMERERRAKIFAPYDALDGYSASVKKKNIEYVEKVYLDESQLAELNRRLLVLHDLTRTLLVDETAISFDDLLSVEAEDEALFRQSTDEDCRG